MDSEERVQLATLIATQCAELQMTIIRRALVKGGPTDFDFREARRILEQLVMAVDTSQ